MHSPIFARGVSEVDRLRLPLGFERYRGADCTSGSPGRASGCSPPGRPRGSARYSRRPYACLRWPSGQCGPWSPRDHRRWSSRNHHPWSPRNCGVQPWPSGRHSGSHPYPDELQPRHAAAGNTGSFPARERGIPSNLRQPNRSRKRCERPDDPLQRSESRR
jgi:hypothetical protein